MTGSTTAHADSTASFYITFPVLSLVNIREAEFPVLVRLINAREKALALLVFRQVEEYFNNPGAVTVEMFLQVHDGTIALLPNALLVAQRFRKVLIPENLRMHSNDKYLLVVRTIKYSNPSTFGKAAGGAPEKIVFQLFRTWLFETKNLTTFRIYTGHDVPDRAVLACSVGRLKN